MLQLFLYIFYGALLVPSGGAPDLPSGGGAFHTEILERINAVRREGCRCGRKRMAPAPPLRWNERLEAAARRHARDMAANNFLDHTGSDGSSFAQRIKATGYDWQYVGENIANGYPDADAAVTGWFESQYHCRNIMDPHFREMGLAQEGDYWVQTLASGWDE